jgi:hypothetical protein
MMVLIGAETAATLSYFRQGNARVMQHDPRAQSLHDAIRILDALAGIEPGHGLAALRMRAPMPIDAAEDILQALTDAGMVAVDRRGRYRLALPREEIVNSDVQRLLLT